jgi:ribonuclease E
MVETNENDKKRTRIFGGRRAKSDAGQPDVAPASSLTEPETKAQPSDPPAAAKAPARRAPAKKASPPKSAAAAAAEKSVSPAVDAAAASESQPAAKKRPAKAAAQKDAAQAESEQKESAKKGSAQTEPAPKDPAKKQPAKKGAAQEKTPAKAPVSPLAPLFQAPDLPPMPERKGNRQAPEGEESSTTLRRRTRRRSGEEGDADAAQPNTVVKVRQPRQQPAPSNEPQRVKGSTRLEAKKQRRRDGRDAGRRRPVITEA